MDDLFSEFGVPNDVDPGQALHDHLLATFPLRDGRRRPVAGESLRVEDRRPADSPRIVWGVTARVPTGMDGLFLLEVFGSPHDAAVAELVAKKGGRVDYGRAVTLWLPVRPKDGKWLRRLATNIKRVVGRGRRYDNRDWVWIADRISDDLRRLAGRLENFQPSSNATVSKRSSRTPSPRAN